MTYEDCLKKKENFIKYSSFSSSRSLIVYLSASIGIYYEVSFINILYILLIFSLFFSIISIYKLINDGFFFKFNSNDAIKYIYHNKKLGLANAFQLSGSNMVKYFIVYKYGIISLGYMTPIFYALNVFTSISSIFESVFSSKISNRIEDSKIKIKIFIKELMKFLTNSK